jgi:hypothetical protein
MTIGALPVALGAGVSLAIHFHPEQLRAPAWVAYAAGGSFALAGAALIAGGPGARECGFSLGFIAGEAPDLLCRVGFGLGALLGLFILALIVRQALRPWR